MNLSYFIKKQSRLATILVAGIFTMGNSLAWAQETASNSQAEVHAAKLFELDPYLSNFIANGDHLWAIRSSENGEKNVVILNEEGEVESKISLNQNKLFPSLIKNNRFTLKTLLHNVDQSVEVFALNEKDENRTYLLDADGEIINKNYRKTDDHLAKDLFTREHVEQQLIIDGKLWVLTSNGLSLLHPDENGFKFNNTKEDLHIGGKNLADALGMVRVGNEIWLPTWGGIYMVNIEDKSIRKFKIVIHQTNDEEKFMIFPGNNRKLGQTHINCAPTRIAKDTRQNKVWTLCTDASSSFRLIKLSLEDLNLDEIPTEGSSEGVSLVQVLGQDRFKGKNYLFDLGLWNVANKMMLGFYDRSDNAHDRSGDKHTLYIIDTE